MKIKSVKTWSENLELTKPYSIAYETIDSVENVFVELELDNGIKGVGSGSPAEFVTGENIDSCNLILKSETKEILDKRNIEDIELICDNLKNRWSKNPAARTAVDIALYDALSKLNGIPLAHLLGKVHESFYTSVTIGIKSIESALEEADDYVNQGFRILKVKTGSDVSFDIELIRKLREKIGKHILIRVDANQGYQKEDLSRFFQMTINDNVEFIEQPLHSDQDSKMDNLPIELRKICVADESLHSLKDAERLAHEPNKFGIYNIKLMKCGGINPSLKIASTAYFSNIDLMWGCMDESIISISAALHAAMACKATKYIDLDGSFDLAKDLVSGGFKLKDGKMFINDTPGIGVKMLSAKLN
jgi:L-alanine-DL-glutamate epimerase-like enolase superfamily enzyme